MSDCIGYLRALERVVPFDVPINNDVIELLSSEDIVVDGVQVKGTKFVIDDASHRFDGFRASDFALGNLLAAGVDLRSQFCRPSNFSAVENMELQFDHIFDYAARNLSSSSGSDVNSSVSVDAPKN